MVITGFLYLKGYNRTFGTGNSPFYIIRFAFRTVVFKLILNCHTVLIIPLCGGRNGQQGEHHDKTQEPCAQPFAFHKFIPSFHAISFESRPGPGFRGCDGVQGRLLICLIGVHRFSPDMDHIYNCGKTPQKLRGNYSIKPVFLQELNWANQQFLRGCNRPETGGAVMVRSLMT